MREGSRLWRERGGWEGQSKVVRKGSGEFPTPLFHQPTTDSCSSAHLFFKDLYSAPCGFSASSGFSAGILFLVQCFFSWCVIDMFSASDCQVCQFESASSLCCVFVLVVVVCTSRQATINFWREKNKYSKCIHSRGAAFGSCCKRSICSVTLH